MLEQARELAHLYGSRLSTSLLQRRLGIGYPRAARLKDMLAEEGLVAGDDPSSGLEGDPFRP
jgi:DNA segregation ATPase FtsK/SpoIIIE-like protein